MTRSQLAAALIAAKNKDTTKPGVGTTVKKKSVVTKKPVKKQNPPEAPGKAKGAMFWQTSKRGYPASAAGEKK